MRDFANLFSFSSEPSQTGSLACGECSQKNFGQLGQYTKVARNGDSLNLRDSPMPFECGFNDPGPCKIPEIMYCRGFNVTTSCILLD